MANSATTALFADERRSPSKNVLALSVAGVRRVWIYMRPNPQTADQESTVSWYLSAAAKPRDPENTLGDASFTDLVLPPSLVRIPPLGGQLMPIAAAFFPPLPTLEGCSFYFSAERHPDAKAVVWAFADTTPHDMCGLFLLPFGTGPLLEREPSRRK